MLPIHNNLQVREVGSSALPFSTVTPSTVDVVFPHAALAGQRITFDAMDSNAKLPLLILESYDFADLNLHSSHETWVSMLHFGVANHLLSAEDIAPLESIKNDHAASFLALGNLSEKVMTGLESHLNKFGREVETTLNQVGLKQSYKDFFDGGFAPDVTFEAGYEYGSEDQLMLRIEHSCGLSVVTLELDTITQNKEVKNLIGACALLFADTALCFTDADLHSSHFCGFIEDTLPENMTESEAHLFWQKVEEGELVFAEFFEKQYPECYSSACYFQPIECIHSELADYRLAMNVAEEEKLLRKLHGNTTLESIKTIRSHATKLVETLNESDAKILLDALAVLDVFDSHYKETSCEALLTGSDECLGQSRVLSLNVSDMDNVLENVNMNIANSGETGAIGIEMKHGEALTEINNVLVASKALAYIVSL